MGAKTLVARTNLTTYQALTCIFAIATVLYLCVTFDFYLAYQTSLDSTATVEVFGSDWPVSTIHAMGFVGWLLIAGPYAVGVLAIQLASIWWFQPTRLWLAIGVIVCLVSGFAALTWFSNS